MVQKATGMNGDDNRSRDNDGQVRHKRSDTHMGIIEEQYMIGTLASAPTCS